MNGVKGEFPKKELTHMFILCDYSKINSNQLSPILNSDYKIKLNNHV